MSYDWNAYEADDKKVAELMGAMSPCFAGYSRMVIALACSRTIAAMFGPAKDESREDYLRRFPGYMRSMWRVMDETIPRGPEGRA
jgi:hypothetical protein